MRMRGKEGEGDGGREGRGKEAGGKGEGGRETPVISSFLP